MNIKNSNTTITSKQHEPTKLGRPRIYEGDYDERVKQSKKSYYEKQREFKESFSHEQTTILQILNKYRIEDSDILEKMEELLLSVDGDKMIPR